MNMKIVIPIATLVAVGISPWQAAVAEMQGGRILDSAIYGAVDGTFSETERQLINRYFDTHQGSSYEQDGGKKKKKSKKNKKQKGMPPGLAKKDKLPPGLQKQLDKNGTLPPGLAKRSLPSDLDSRLPPVPEGMERVIADAHVMLVDKASGVIKDIIKDIVK